MIKFDKDFDPKNIRFVRYGDLVLFQEKSFLKKFNINSIDEFIQHCFQDDFHLINALKSKFKFKRFGFLSSIHDDNFRTPNVRLIYSDDQHLNLLKPDHPIDPWVIHSDNAIKYTFDVTRMMFCKGNIVEKLRLSRFQCHNEIIVDLFAGIGYFALIFAVHCKAKHVYCCEWDPFKIEALKRNICLNHVQDRITVLFGDNRQVCPKKLAQRVQMGLLPTSVEYLNVALEALQIDNNIQKGNQIKEDKQKTILTLHVHENFNYYNTIKQHLNDQQTLSSEKKKQLIQMERNRWAEKIVEKIHNLFINIVNPNNRTFQIKTKEITRVKQYAPYIDHLVADVEVEL